MYDITQIGPFILRTQWIIIIFSVLTGYFVMKRRLNSAGNFDRTVLTTIENSLIIVLLVWKFSVILVDPLKIIHTPLALLYFSGGEFGIGLAAIVAILYIFLHARNKKVSVLVYGDLLLTGFFAASATYFLFNLILNSYKVIIYGSNLIISLLLLLFIFKRNKEFAKPNYLIEVLIWLSLSQGFIRFLDPLKQNFWWRFSKEQIFFLTLAGLCMITNWVIVPILQNRKEDFK